MRGRIGKGCIFLEKDRLILKRVYLEAEHVTSSYVMNKFRIQSSRTLGKHRSRVTRLKRKINPESMATKS